MTPDGKPNYYRLNTGSLDILGFLTKREKLIFIEELINENKNALDDNYKPEEQPGILGKAIQQMHIELKEGIKSYLKCVYANPSGCKGKQKDDQNINIHIDIVENDRNGKSKKKRIRCIRKEESVEKDGKQT